MELVNDTREQLRDLMENRNLRQTDIAAGCGLSNATISQYLAGSYKGNIQDVEDKIASYIAIESERDPHAEKQLPFVMTSVAKKVFEVARTCHRDGVIGLCVGDSGIGKTRAIKEYSSQNRGVLLIEAHRAYRTRDVIADLHVALRLGGTGSIHRMLRDITQKLKGSGRLVIVDEAEHLSTATLDEIRRLNDWANIGILYVGLDRFRAQLHGMRGDFAYIVNRIRIPAALKHLRPKDTEALVHTKLPKMNGLCRVYHEQSKGVTRTLESLIDNTIRVAELNNTEITAELIRQVAEELTV